MPVQRRSSAFVNRLALAGVALLLAVSVFPGSVRAQQPVEPATVPLLGQQALRELVAPLALYPDDLLAIMLPAATYPLQVVEAARFLDDREQDPSLTPDPAWDDAVVALLNYPEALDLLNDDLAWTWQLGEAVLAQQADVLEAVELFRDEAYLAGNLASDDRQRVERDDTGIRIVPADPEVIYVPYYDPVRVVVRYPYRPYYYHAQPYPLYYYPYDIGHRFYANPFWGVTTAFSISWHNHYLHLNYYDHYRHPFYGRRYHIDRFYRHRRSIDHHVFVGGVRERHRGDYYRWYPNRFHGVRPGYNRYSNRGDRRVLSYSSEGQTQALRERRDVRQSNASRQRYQTYDNVIDRDRSRARVDRRGVGDDRSRERRAENRLQPDRNNRFARSDSTADTRAAQPRSERRAISASGRDAAQARDRDNARRLADPAAPPVQRFRSAAQNRAAERAAAVQPRTANPQRRPETQPRVTQPRTVQPRESRQAYPGAQRPASQPPEARSRMAPATRPTARPTESRSRYVAPATRPAARPTESRSRYVAPQRSAAATRQASPRRSERAPAATRQRSRDSAASGRSSRSAARSSVRSERRTSSRRER